MRNKAYVLFFLSLSLLFLNSSSFSFGSVKSILKFINRVEKWKTVFDAFNTSSLLEERSYQIGENVTYLPYYKLYLDYYNYLNTPNVSGIYTYELQSALKKFQNTFGLVSNGQLDTETVSLIMTPRCGIPDIINGVSIIMEDGTMTFNNSWWPTWKKEFTYAFSPENDTTLSRPAFSDAFDRWSNVTGLSFTETPLWNESDIQIVFRPLDGKKGVVGGTWFDNTNGSLVVYLDSNESWASPTDAMHVDMESAAMHQIGHVLGFGHATIREAVMYPFLKLKERNVAFAKAELDSIHLQYGGAAGRAEPGWKMVSTLCLSIASAWLFWF
ncbi:metalloendoproteinase 5-MMP-like [Prosopis cineraria]|uniref:metalloendoproteinase 5-MMP-like n=1 Tax=Prosopis cineraria TaxID=364024 RepID=UPI00240F1A86|nr:metalloendoproteinase 5-MMP-like [Prosopis cineraria]